MYFCQNYGEKLSSQVLLSLVISVLIVLINGRVECQIGCVIIAMSGLRINVRRPHPLSLPHVAENGTWRRLSDFHVSGRNCLLSVVLL